MLEKKITMEIGKEIKQKKFESEFHKAHLNLMYTSNWLQSKSKLLLKPYSITSQQYNVLRILKGKHPDSCSAGDILAVMLDKSPDLTRLIDRLIAKDYVSRCVCPENRRKLDIVITNKGTALLKEINPIIKEEFEKLNTITKKEATELSRILDKLRD